MESRPQNNEFRNNPENYQPIQVGQQFKIEIISNITKLLRQAFVVVLSS